MNHMMKMKRQKKKIWKNLLLTQGKSQNIAILFRVNALSRSLEEQTKQDLIIKLVGRNEVFMKEVK